MAKKQLNKTSVKISDFTKGLAIFKGDRNASGVFNATFEFGGDSMATDHRIAKFNRILLTLTDPANPTITTKWRLDKNLARWSGQVFEDVKAFAALLDKKGANALTEEFDDSEADGKILKPFASSDLKVQTSIKPNSTKDDDGLYPMVIEWA